MKSVGLKLEKSSYTVRERTQFDSTPNKYDVYDPENEEIILLCIEEDIDIFNTNLRMVKFNTFTPFQIAIKLPDGERIYILRRHPDLLNSKVVITNTKGELWLAFNEKKIIYPTGVILEVVDKFEKTIFTLCNEGEMYILLENNITIGKIFHKKMKTPKNNILMIDNYIIDIPSNVPQDSPIRLLLVLTAVCLDILFFDGIDIL